MAVVVEIPARDWTFEVNDGTVASPNFKTVEHVMSWSHGPQSSDTSVQTFDDNGRMNHYKSSRGDQFTLTCLFGEDTSNGNRSPGQEAMEDWAALVGYASKQQFRITSPGGTVKTFLATCQVTQGGGGNDDPTAWEAQVTVAGAITTT